MKYKRADLVKVAGGAKALATPEIEPEEKHALGQIEKSIRLHGTKRIVLMVHSECGAYGKRFKTGTLEQKFYAAELRKAKQTVSAFLKHQKIKKPIDTYFADFSGLWRV